VPGLLTGALWLRLETLPDRYVSPSTGRLALTTVGSGEIVAQQAARAAGTPVLPGSGIKGAVRTLYELLSFSCDPLLRTRDGCSPHSCCDACALFGLPSYSGRVSFSDAVPAGENLVQVEVRKTPIPWTPKRDRTPGDFRLYDFGEATLPGAARRTPQKQPKELAREVFVGTFETRMSFTNLTGEEIGRLLLALGLGRDLATRFYLRLGGVKYDGQGAVRVMPQKLRLAGKKVVEGDACRAECARWIETAGTSPWAATFWPTLDELAAVLGPRNGHRGVS
jgi:CRISPR/Cas system CSM-associated protein Csm3 (group 7 of RAMP superfamily)